MQKKLMIFSLIISFVLIIVLVVYMIKDSKREDIIKTEVACQKIEYYTKNYFSFLEDIKIDSDTENTAISISFIPEVGSFPVKEEIYQSIAYHALQIVEFFPEVNQFNYIVLWDDYTKQEVLNLTIDEVAIKALSNIFFNEYINQRNGFETSYKNVFSSIVETEESKSWRDKINTYSDTP